MTTFDRAAEEVKLATYLGKRVCDHASGRLSDECLNNYPRDVYFIGNLRPRDNTAPSNAELMHKLAPVAFGAEFRISPTGDEAGIKVTLSWSCYYRVFPTLMQQRSHQRYVGGQDDNGGGTDESSTISLGATSDPSEDTDVNLSDPTPDASPELNESPEERKKQRTPQDSLFIRYRRINCQSSGTINLNRQETGNWEADKSELQVAIDQETARAKQKVGEDIERLRSARAGTHIRVPDTALASQTAYDEFLSGLAFEIVPEWRWEVSQPEIRPGDLTDASTQSFSIEFVNASPTPPSDPNVEPFLFDTCAVFELIECLPKPFELELGPESYRYNRTFYGRGFNCNVLQSRKSHLRFYTTHTPTHTQKRYQTRDTPTAGFHDLVSSPISTLQGVLDAMNGYLAEWDRYRDRYAAEEGWEERHGAIFTEDRALYEAEIQRFARGFEAINSNKDVRYAFELTNEVFRRSGEHPDPSKRKTAWRLFQLVFLVSQLPGIAGLMTKDKQDLDDREYVDIIYFPTGGGKTEAYLAVLIFHLFLDRLRGKAAGVTAWTRFPLRLLTLQQTQRVADVVGLAELLRREQTDPRLSSKNVDGFAVGYFVGESGSPNEITNPELVRYPRPAEMVTWSQVHDDTERQSWKRVTRCPSCRTFSVQIEFDPNATRLLHRCVNPSCVFPSGELPIYIVDNEIYRYLPAVIVGTIDKLASVGNQRKMAMIFGQVSGRCNIHGYYSGQCCQKECNNKLGPRSLPDGISGPTLFVQDELHLLKEGFGTFDSHYESFVQTLRVEFGQSDTLKIIASSATIEAFERQVHHLYGRQARFARIFPGIGPVQGESFYASTLRLAQRIFIGLLPHNKTIFNAILEIIELYHREVQALVKLTPGQENPYEGDAQPGTDEWLSLLDAYVTSLTYFLAGRELDSIRTDLEGDVNPNLERDRFTPLSAQILTGSTGTDEVSRTLEHLETPARAESSDAVLATSMISHGVDVDRLNAMIFYGMPRQTAEYIQASSRVGRSHVGLVFNCLHPARERDQSHYAYFSKYHEFMGRLVEPVAINRWAKYSINRTLPGLFMAVLLQLISNRDTTGKPGRYYMLDFLRKKISQGSIAQGGIASSDFIGVLERSYLVSSPVTPGETVFHDEIKLRVPQFLDQIVNASSDQEWISDVLIPRPMRSLRDVDEPIDIELDSLGSQWSVRTRT